MEYSNINKNALAAQDPRSTEQFNTLVFWTFCGVLVGGCFFGGDFFFGGG